MALLEVDPNFSIHTSYHNDFFLLRTKVLVNGENTEIRSKNDSYVGRFQGFWSVRVFRPIFEGFEGTYEGPVLSFCHSGRTISTELWLFAEIVSRILQQYGVYHVDALYYERSPLFRVVFTSESCLKKFILAIGEVKSALEPKLRLFFARRLNSVESVRQLTVGVHPELFLVSPDRHRGFENYLVTAENYSTSVTRWKNSKLFDFGSPAIPPEISLQPTSQKNVPTGKSVAFSVEATGTQPLSYQWQWRKKGAQEDEWQNLSGEGVTFQVAAVEVSNAGDYRCLVSNSAGSKTSHCANLTVAVPPEISLQPTSQKNVPSGKSVVFSVEATGTQPLSYQWQWRKENAREDEWQNLSGGGDTFQVAAVQASNAGDYRCVVSNFAGSETSQYASLTVAIELVDLVRELQDVSDWITFGLYLGVRMSRLEAIKEDFKTVDKCRREMLNVWQKTFTPTWSAVVQALVGIGMRRLAFGLAQKLGIPDPKLPNDDPMDQLEDIFQQDKAKLAEEIEKLRGDLTQHEQELMDVRKCLAQSLESNAKANEKTLEAINKLKESGEKVQKISDDKTRLEMELQIKERECQLLSEMQEKNNQDLRYKVDKKREKIKKLKEKLESKERELKSALEDVQILKEKLSQALKEKEEKHKEVMQLQSKKDKLECSCNTKREYLSKLVQALSSDKEEMKQQLTSIKRESEHKSQQIEACNANISCLSEATRDLSSSLKEKESTVEQLQSKLKMYQEVASSPESLLRLVKLITQIAELEGELQEAEYEKRQAELEREATLQEIKVRRKLMALLCAQLDELPKVTEQPKSQRNVRPGTAVSFTIQATGMELSYQWQCKPAEKEGRSEEEWQPCDAEWSDDGTLTIPKVQKSNEGSYRCIITNCGGSQTSKAASLSIADPPKVTSHPQEQDAIVGELVMLTTEAIGTRPLSYQWEWKPAGSGQKAWQPCDVERLPGADSSSLTILSVQKSNAGSYRCVIHNCAGTLTSNPANLSVANPTRIISQPQELKDAVEGKPATFTVQATGTNLNYQWQWKPAAKKGWMWWWDGSEEWQPCDAEWSDGGSLTIPKVQKSNEGSYRCVISNSTGSQTSESAKLEVI